ncbi:hypothetical protein Cni_G10653 [Canna indica]|uniref:Uncharacterized protein n=1 Tax=Canna indica TaxID=4628 RepID=A0AAQ3Q8S1_9LILI|nr:hypothetical protein Cni_G10653 [Canna indica]
MTEKLITPLTISTRKALPIIATRHVKRRRQRTKTPTNKDARSMPDNNQRWNWPGRAEMFDVISIMTWCQQNKPQACLYIGMILYCTALFAADGSRYIRMVTYVAPCLTAVRTVAQIPDQIISLGSTLQKLEELTRQLALILDRANTEHDEDLQHANVNDVV